MQRLVGSIVAVLFLDITFLLRTAANIFSYFTQSNGERVFYIRPFLPFELPDWNDYYFTLIALIFGGFFCGISYICSLRSEHCDNSY